MSEPKSILMPPEGLTEPADPRSGQKSKLALFTDNWLELQSYIGAALELPLTTGDFEAKYGSIGSSPKKTLADCISAMRGVREASTEFGDPKAVRKVLMTDPGFLGRKDPPNEIYAHTVWLGQKVYKTAGTIATGYKEFIGDWDDIPRNEKVQAVKDYLFNARSGPIPLSKQMSDEVGVLIKKLGKFEQRMSEYNEKMKEFTGGSSAMVQLVSADIGGLDQKIKNLEKSRDDAYKAWKDFTIAAVTCAVGCALIGVLLAPFTGGVSLLVGAAGAIATGVGLGIKAAQNRASYNQFCVDISTAQEDRKKKVRLRSDLADFNLQMAHVGPAMAGFVKSLQGVQSVWATMNGTLVSISQDFTESNLGSIPRDAKGGAAEVIDRWQEIRNDAHQFTQDLFIDYDSIAFGQLMPEKAAA